MDTLSKFQTDSFVYTIDMHRAARLNNGDTIASVVSITSAEPTLSLTEVAHDSKYNVEFRLAGGVASRTHAIEVVVQTALGDTVTGRVYIEVLA